MLSFFNSCGGRREKSTIILPIPASIPSSASNRRHSVLNICNFAVAAVMLLCVKSDAISSSAILPGALTALISHTRLYASRSPLDICQHSEVTAAVIAIVMSIFFFISFSSNEKLTRSSPAGCDRVERLVRDFLSI